MRAEGPLQAFWWGGQRLRRSLHHVLHVDNNWYAQSRAIALCHLLTCFVVSCHKLVQPACICKIQSRLTLARN